MKVVGEREILASLVEFKHHLMAETIRNEKGEKKTKAEAPGLTKKIKSIKLQTSISPQRLPRHGADFLTVCRSDLDLTPVKISDPPRQWLRR